MDIQDYIQDAISMVDSWDLPEEEFSEAVNRLCPDYINFSEFTCQHPLYVSFFYTG